MAHWTDEQVENLNRYQNFGLFHGFTCGNDHDGARKLVATTEGWVCPSCEYKQDLAHDYMLEFTEAEEEETLKLYPFLIL